MKTAELETSLQPLAKIESSFFVGGNLRSELRSLPCEVAVAMVFDGTTLAVMMASPSDLEALAIGFALSEGVITRAAEIEQLEIIEHDKGLEAQMRLAPEQREALDARRRMMAGPVGCGLCGIDSLQQAIRPLPSVSHVGTMFAADEIAGASAALDDLQPLHHQTHASHAAGFLIPGKGIVKACEDVGRHNALDKLVGSLANDQIEPSTGAFVMTSRLSVELVQKSAMAHCPVLIAVSAPTEAAVELARSCGVTLVAFARNGTFEIFTHPHRISMESPHVP